LLSGLRFVPRSELWYNGRGDTNRRWTEPESDLDILAIMSTSRTGREWVAKIHDEVDRGIACDIMAYNERELVEMLPVNRFLRQVPREGKVVYDA
jgi:hypothetical protein